MKVYGARIVQARQIRGLMRHQLARLIQLTTAELRHYERTHGYYLCRCCPLEVEMPDMLVTRIGFALRFPYKFFLQPVQEHFDYKKIFWCQSFESKCFCGERGTRLCDGLINVWNPDTKRYEERTCDSPICDACTYRIGDVDYCMAHRPPEKKVKKR